VLKEVHLTMLHLRRYRQAERQAVH
jgi:hypothetical protein